MKYDYIRDPSLIESIEKELSDTKAKLTALVSNVQDHYNQKGDNRCHLDDDLLYWKVLGIGSDPYATALPPEGDMLESCRRYIKQRQHPEACGKGWMPHEMTIYQLSDLVERYEKVIRKTLADFEAIIGKMRGGSSADA